MPPISETQWNLLHAVRPSQPGRYATIASSAKIGGEDVLLALDAEGCRHLLIPLSDGGPMAEDRASRGIQATLHTLVQDGRDRRFLDLACRHSHLNEVFTIVASEVVEKLDGTQPPDRICSAVLDRWRELLKSEASELLSRNVLIGLYGELWHLRHLARLRPDAVRVWLGPERHRHDFVCGSTALEVKTTTGRTGRSYEIHGADQLEPPTGGRLFLAGMKIELVPEGGESVPEIIRGLLDLGVPGQELLAKLARLGYAAVDEQAYRSLTFSVLESCVYEVNESFPRIVPGSFAGGTIPPGVIAVSYVIELSAESPHPLAAEDVEQVYRNLAGVEA